MALQQCLSVGFLCEAELARDRSRNVLLALHRTSQVCFGKGKTTKQVEVGDSFLYRCEASASFIGYATTSS